MNDGARRRRLVLVTGLSGSGRSTVGKCFEDLGYHCVDNLPLPLLERLLSDPTAGVPETVDLAVVTDVRAPGFAERFPRMVEAIDRTEVAPILLFLEANEETLVRRFSETRRTHPLAGERPLIESIRRERELLAELRGSADRIYDTSEWTLHELRHQVYREFGDRSEGGEPGLDITITSFGFKYGIPYGTDLLFDVRFLPNPHFVADLREQTGEDEPVRAYLEERQEYRELVARLEDFLLYLLPNYEREERSYLSIGIGCTGGRHRSVAVSRALVDRLTERGWPARLSHRDVER
ncbi:MAG: RNase adapter RapZ [Thermoanaerobaculia bacterium]